MTTTYRVEATTTEPYVSPLILTFSQISATDIGQVGGKGANLGKLTRAGFNVPPGFCVAVTAFRRFMDACGDTDRLYAQLESLRLGDVVGVRRVGEQVRSQLQQVAIPDEVCEAVVTAWKNLGSEHAYAVRSSATAEDLPGASFAGQQDTFLNVRDEKALLTSVKNCWISLFTDRAILYRLQNGFGHREVALSVVVQRMVEPEVSGIMFTADPVTGKRSVLSIDASFGLGEALVSGLVSADLYKIDKREDTLLARQIADKQLIIRSLPGGGIEQVALGDQERRVAALSDKQALELARLGARIEAHYGTPQDIGWALREDDFYILQSRPITSLFPLPEPAPKDAALHLYLSFGHFQVMTDPISEMGRSLWRALVPMGRGKDALENPYLVSAAGRLYIDVSPMLRQPLGKRLLPKILNVADPLIASALQTVCQRNDFLRRGGRAGWHDLQRWIAPLFLRAMAHLWLRHPEGQAEKLYRQITDNVQRSKAQLAAEPAGAARIKAVQSLFNRAFVEQAFPLPPYIIAGVLANTLLKRMMSDEANRDDLTALTRGLRGNVTTEMDLAVGDLADAARKSPELAVHLSRTGDEARILLDTASALPGSESFLQAWSRFLAQYGMRGPSEIDIARPRWYEDPGSLLQMVVGNLQHSKAGMHRAYHHQLVEDGDAAAGRLVQAAKYGVWGWLKGPIVKRLVRVARHLLGVREHPKFLLVQLLGLVKPVIAEVAEQLVTEGRLEKIDDVWLFSLPELIELLEHSDLDLRRQVEQRQINMTRFHGLTPPRVMTSEGEIPAVKYAAIDAPEGALIGNPVSAGVVEGSAHVVLDPRHEVLRPGEILVAPFTDPGWTPLFIQAAGLVTEVGGLMTHGSVVAREYGIPAVVGVSDATKRIQTGQRIRVHGNAGYVEVLEGKANG